jgi:hypothetical protein
MTSTNNFVYNENNFVHSENYIGEVYLGQPHGRGKSYVKGTDKISYDGEWKNGRRDGYGTDYGYDGDVLYCG